MRTMAELPKSVDLVTPVGRGIEEHATVAEIRAALTEYRKRYGELPWNLLLTQGRA